MGEICIIGEKSSSCMGWQNGWGVFHKELPRAQFARYMADHPACEVVIEVCPTSLPTEHEVIIKRSACRQDPCEGWVRTDEAVADG
jgi:hypothetical protein